jgi:aminopeptidase N
LGIYKQAPVRDFLYAGMENTSATLFNTRYVVDSTGFEDRSYTNVNAHELAHQWFGNLVTESENTIGCRRVCYLLCVAGRKGNLW